MNTLAKNENEPKNPYRVFLRNYKEVVRFAVESLFDKTLEENEPKDYKSEIKRPYDFTEEEFFEFLCIDRKVKELLARDLRQSKEYICLVGPRGAGKSTVGRKLIRELEASKTESNFVIFLDVRYLKENLKLGAGHKLFDELKHQIKVEYLTKLFPQKGQGSIHQLDLWSYLLEPSPNNKLPSQLSADFFYLQNQAELLYENQRITGKESSLTMREWLKDTHITDPEVRRLVLQLNRKLSITHLAYATRDLCKYDNQIIWLDNTDALDHDLQSEVINIARSLHTSIGNIVSTIIAIREENVFRDEDPFEEHGAPPFSKRVRLSISDDGKGNKTYDAYNLSILKVENLQKIIEERFKLARKKQGEYHDFYVKKIAEQEEKIQQFDPMREVDSIKAAGEKIEEYKIYLNDYAPLLKDGDYSKLRMLSKNVLQTLDDDKVIYLTNSSLREFLFIHRDVVSHVLRNADYDIDKALSFPPWFISTLIYNWLAMTDRDYQIPMQNIIEETVTWIQDGRRNIGCSLQYLVVTTIWNLTVKDRSYLSPTVKEVVDKLSLLDFKQDEIINALVDLQVKGDKRVGIVEFRHKGKINRNWERIKDIKVYLSYRGRCLISLSGNTFGHFYGNLQRYVNKSASADQIPPLEETKASEYAEQMLPFLCDIAQMHYDTLREFRTKSSLTPNQWFNNYCEHFGIPQKEPYKRSIKIGTDIKGLDRALQFEALISGLTSYRAGGQLRLDKSSVKEKMENLRKKFDESIKALKNDEFPPEVNFRNELGIGN